ncbi:MAG: alkaline phosphatase [Syntrophorhabdaceae bacterium]|nr:alkaline phosphatase [Syntrophorhabdaceae bacterium]
MERRDFLKVSMASFLALVAPAEEAMAKLFSSPQRKAKGIIFLVGDGWPLGVMKATHEFKLKRFKEKSHIYELLGGLRTRILLQNTSSLSSVVTDSAPASVAWATGSKTANRMLSSLPDGRRLTTIFELAREKGIACGVVTTTRLTHATPAAWYSHNVNRDAEEDIAGELLNSGLMVALGGGDRFFDGEKRKDKQDLYNKFRNKGYEVSKNREELLRTKSDNTPLLGVFNSSHLSYFVDRINDKRLGSLQPTLPEMTSVALDRLSRNPKGFILQVEAGRIDHANHANDAYGAMMDSYEMDNTLAVIIEFIKYNPQVLLIVASDHGNGGYGINGTGPEYNDATKALFKYDNKASFEYMINQFKGKDVKALKEIFEGYTQQSITFEEAEEIYKQFTEPKKYIINDFVYEPEATMGRILLKSVYEGDGDRPKTPEVVRRGNIGFTSTNHTAEDQIVILYSVKPLSIKIPPHIDNTELFKIMCHYFGIRYQNPKMKAGEAFSYIKPVGLAEWKRHLELHYA